MLENCRVGVHLCHVRNAREDANELESERNHESDALENIRVGKCVSFVLYLLSILFMYLAVVTLIPLRNFGHFRNFRVLRLLW